MLRELGVQNFWPVTADEAEARPVVVAPVEPVAPTVSAEPAMAGSARPVDQGTRPASALAPAAPPSPAMGRPPKADPEARGQAPRVLPSVSAEALALGPRPVGVEAMDWPALREAVAGCQACGLCRTRRQTVFGVGHPKAQWMLVGEAAGEQEDRHGEPFVGRAGQLLDRMLMAVGLTRAAAPPEAQVFIANVIKCRPPGNRNPQPEEVAQCEPFLLRQVALVQPRLIVAMGRFAVQSLLKTAEPIGKLRGRVHDFHGVPLVVTYHPAYLLRNPADQALAWGDLCLAREVLSDASSHRGMDSGT